MSDMNLTKVFAAASVLVASFFSTACSQYPSQHPPIWVFPDMKKQDKYKPQMESAFWSDRRTTRRPPAGTIAQGALREGAYFTGVENGQYVSRNPEPITKELLLRGQERFNIYCAPCHDRTGSGHGVVPSRATWVPGNMHDERIVGFVDGEIFHVISNGRRSMPGYKYQIPESDRWAIVSYVRALQRAWRGTMTDVPAELQSKLR